MYFLKQSTAATLRVGPAVAIADGVTPVTTLSLAAADQAELLKHTGATVDLVSSPEVLAAIANVGGWYNLTLSTSHTDTLGMLTVVIQDASACLPIFISCMVCPANVWDTLFGADKLDVNAAEWLGQTIAPVDTNGYPKVTLKNGTGTGEVALASGRANADIVYVGGSAVSATTAQLGVNVVNAGGTAWASGALTSGVFASGAITAGAIAADAIGASELAADAVTEIVTAIKAAVIESNGSVTLQQAISVMLAALAGVTASGGTVLKDPSGTATRISATVNGSNERTAMTLTPSA